MQPILGKQGAGARSVLSQDLPAIFLHFVGAVLAWSGPSGPVSLDKDTPLTDSENPLTRVLLCGRSPFQFSARLAQTLIICWGILVSPKGAKTYRDQFAGGFAKSGRRRNSKLHKSMFVPPSGFLEILEFFFISSEWTLKLSRYCLFTWKSKIGTILIRFALKG